MILINFAYVALIFLMRYTNICESPATLLLLLCVAVTEIFWSYYCIFV